MSAPLLATACRLVRLPFILLILGIVAGCGSGSPSAPGRRGDPPAPADSGVVLDEDLSARQLFPADNWWNLDVSPAPVDPRSQQIIDWISGRTPSNPNATTRMHPDFGPPPYGIPYAGVSGTQPRLNMTFVWYGGESDPGAPGGPPGYPIPSQARTLPGYIEGGVPGGGTSGDRHMLLVDRDHGILFELYATHWNAILGRWEAGSGAVFDLTSNARRPEGWTSADAAGLAILPGLVRYDEVYGSGEIGHAFRFTTRGTNGYVFPASHAAGSDPDAPPMGTRLRLKASTNRSGFPPEMQKIFRAMQTHGLILADNGSDLYVTGTMDARWNNDVLNPAFHGLHADDFEVIQRGWNPVATDAR